MNRRHDYEEAQAQREYAHRQEVISRLVRIESKLSAFLESVGHDSHTGRKKNLDNQLTQAIL